MKTKTAVGGIMGALVAMIGSPAPEHLGALFMVVMGLIAMDTFCGVWLAAIQGRLSSDTLRRKLYIKLLQYTLLATLFAGVTLLARTWWVFQIGIGGIGAIELLSMMETAVSLEGEGVKLGPLKPLLERIRKYLGDGGTGSLTLPTGNSVTVTGEEKRV